MKNKNPLYVVKGKEVQEASSLLDLFIKKFNLTPVINILQVLLKMLLEQVENFAMFVVVKSYIDEVIKKVMDLGMKLGLA